MNFKEVLALPKTARSAQTHKSIRFIWIVWSTLYVYLWIFPPLFDDYILFFLVYYRNFYKEIKKRFCILNFIDASKLDFIVNCKCFNEIKKRFCIFIQLCLRMHLIFILFSIGNFLIKLNKKKRFWRVNHLCEFKIWFWFCTFYVLIYNTS